MKQKKQKIGFSKYFDKVSFDKEVLVIKGDKFLTVLIMFLFMIGMIWCLTLDMPLLFKGGILFSFVLSSYALLDVLLSKKYLIYDVKSKHISLHRKSLRESVVYNGPSEKFLKLRKVVDVDIESDIPGYFIELVFDNGQVFIPYQLNRWSLPEAKADILMQEWQLKLEL